MAAVVAGGVLVAATAGAFDAKPPAKPITIKGCQAKQAPVPFDHPEHVKGVAKAGFGCVVCHHQVKGKAPEKNRCSACHATKQGEKIGTCKDASQTTNPFHTVCAGCHKQMQAEHPTAPTKCAGCHKK